MKRPTIKIFLRTDFTKKDGTNPVCLRFTLNRKPKVLSLDISTSKNNWIESKQRISKSDPDHDYKNDLLDLYENRAKKILFDYKIKHKHLSFQEFSDNFRMDNYGSTSFFDFVQNMALKYKNIFSPGTIKNYNYQLNKLKDFRPELFFDEIDTDFMLDYHNFLTGNRQNNKNTAIKSLSFVKSMVNKAVNLGIIKESLCKKYKQERIEGDREFLTLTELQMLDRKYHDGEFKPNKANVLRYFLFSCYTGLRYLDIKNLRFKNINEDVISVKMHKVKKTVRIPLSSKAKKLIPGNNAFEEQKVFRVLSDQPTNRYLKEIMAQAEINKSISFHCSRHTFATNGLELEIPLEVIQELLGHDDIKTTRIYAKMLDSRKKKEMDKWE